jgi:hypothetical protein
LKKYFYLFYVSGLVIAPLVLFLLPADFFDTGESICLSVQLFDIQCYGCGMTRAIQHLIHFDFQEAYDYNKLSFLVVFVLFIVWIQEIRRILRRLKQEEN